MSQFEWQRSRLPILHRGRFPDFMRASACTVCMYTRWPKKTGTVNILGLCSDQQLSLFPLLDRASFPH